MSSVANRLRDLDPRVVDATLAAALVLGCLVEVLVYGDGKANRLVYGGIGVAGLVAMALRRSRPLAVAAIVTASMVVAALGAHFYLASTTTPYFAAMILIYTLGRYVRGWRGAAVATFVAAMLTVVSSIAQEEVFEISELFWLVVVGLGPFLVGRVLGDRARLQAEIRDRTRELERDRELRAERAVEQERVRLAAELQSVIANGVSAMVVQAEAVPRVMASGDRERAAGTLAVIEETGRDALGEMRRLLGVLRRADDGAALAPQPGLSEVGRLVDRVAQEGLAVELRFDEECVELGAGPDLVAYRVVQQALAGAVSGGASRASVAIDCDDDELRIVISDDRRDAGGEHAALTATRERLGLYGGRLRAEATDGGAGFTVQARMPLEGVAR